ncbi:putative ski2-type helicase [Enhygromyxa salina]|uniref:Putative ski2-type helicase n=1 Tax=Enhygromyxa salina TaxID=215803 RepID=A0A0C1ZGL2_9BACT|nr:DEAD/DEAH box helicase [Enhygromyxa salina]KIG16749.1 putative ski2-type helicase [Enhygromyxa salina]
MSSIFPPSAEYQNYVPFNVVRPHWDVAVNTEVDVTERLRAIAEIRKVAHAHSVAAEAAKHGLWESSGDALNTHQELSIAAGQLYLRAARLEAKVGMDPGQVRELQDRVDASLSFLMSQYQAISSTVAGLMWPLSSECEGELASIFRAAFGILVNAGRPDSQSLEGMADFGDQEQYDLSQMSDFVEVLTARTHTVLKMLSRYFVYGDTLAISDVCESLNNVSSALDILGGGELSYIIERIVSNLEWLTANSVWRLPRALGIDEDSDFGKEVVRMLVEQGKFFLFPKQWEGIRNFKVCSTDTYNVISMPTGAGKSLLAEIIITRHLHDWTMAGTRKSKRAFFVVPSRALAREKMLEIRRILKNLESLRASVCQLTGDILLNAEEALREYDIIVVTPEKMDMVMRHRDLRAQIGAVVVDEFHNIGKGARGLRLLNTVARIRNNQVSKSASVHLASAIVRPEDISRISTWLSAESAAVRTFRSDTPSIFTRCGVFDYSGQRNSPIWRIDYDDGTSETVAAPPPPKKKWAWNQHGRASEMLAVSLVDEGATMVFATSARWRFVDGESSCPPIDKAVSIAELLEERPGWINDEENLALVEGLRRLWGQHPLVDAARKGVVAHWGGLPLRGRRLVEKAILKKGAAILVATSTLAEGVNMPLRRLIIPKCDFNGEMFDTGFFLNLKGRAGRPFMTEEGEVILVASKATTLEQVQKLRRVSSEDIESLRSPVEGEGGAGVEDALDGAVLAVVAEESPLRSDAESLLVARVTLSDDGGPVVHQKVTESVGRLRQWGLVDDFDDTVGVTPMGVAVYESGFSPSDAIKTRRDGEDSGQLGVLDRTLPLSPKTDGAYDALGVLLDMLSRTGSWEQLERVGIRSAKQATFFMSQWIHGSTIVEISKKTNNHRVYMHSILEGVLAPTCAWFFLSLSAWVSDVYPGNTPGSLTERLQKWAEYAWFGSPPGLALRLLGSDFQGGWYRDDALVVCGAIPRDVSRILNGTSRFSERDIYTRLGRAVEFVDSPRVIAERLYELQERASQRES